MRSIVIGCLYLPNGNPAAGPKFDCKLRWLEHHAVHACRLLDSGQPAVLAGDFTVIRVRPRRSAGWTMR